MSTKIDLFVIDSKGKITAFHKYYDETFFLPDGAEIQTAELDITGINGLLPMVTYVESSRFITNPSCVINNIKLVNFDISRILQCASWETIKEQLASNGWEIF
ncbi:hypothetical protein C0584_01975 [Candidatus Parcubacteria bacterium]|nr:MAG: hypothetical protein C0584_01975 [Candidatus Parcubacteria bacterium]